MAQEYNSDLNAFITAAANPSNQADLSVNKAKKNQDKEVKKQTDKVKDNRIAPGGGAAYSDSSKNVKDAEYEQSKLSALTQMAPIAYNLGMGLFGKKDEITLSKLDPITFK